MCLDTKTKSFEGPGRRLNELVTDVGVFPSIDLCRYSSKIKLFLVNVNNSQTHLYYPDNSFVYIHSSPHRNSSMETRRSRFCDWQNVREEHFEETSERKPIKYWEMVEKCGSRGWRTNDQPAEVTCRGFEGHSTGGFGLKELICGIWVRAWPPLVGSSPGHITGVPVHPWQVSCKVKYHSMDVHPVAFSFNNDIPE